MKTTRKGFTLVELLIVIAILGALASMMSLSGTNATASARAATIVSDLKTLKTAALLFYNDYYLSSGDGVNAFTQNSFNAHSADYIDPAALKIISKDYAILIKAATTTAPSEWYAGYLLGVGAEDAQVAKLLKARASKLGLLMDNTSVKDNLKAVPKASINTTYDGSSINKGGTVIMIRVR